jgi:hypothetical protein
MSRMYGSMSKHKNNPLTKSLRPLLYDKWTKTTKKTFFMLFLVILEPFWHPQMDPKRVYKGLQMIKMCGSLSKFKNKPQTKSLRPFF